jgi:hypothetical protein
MVRQLVGAARGVQVALQEEGPASTSCSAMPCEAVRDPSSACRFVRCTIDQALAKATKASLQPATPCRQFDIVAAVLIHDASLKEKSNCGRS